MEFLNKIWEILKQNPGNLRLRWDLQLLLPVEQLLVPLLQLVLPLLFKIFTIFIHIGGDEKYGEEEREREIKSAEKRESMFSKKSQQ